MPTYVGENIISLSSLAEHKNHVNEAGIPLLNVVKMKLIEKKKLEAGETIDGVVKVEEIVTGHLYFDWDFVEFVSEYHKEGEEVEICIDQENDSWVKGNVMKINQPDKTYNISYVIDGKTNTKDLVHADLIRRVVDEIELEGEPSPSKPQDEGKKALLTVNKVRIENLIAVDVGGSSDPYCIFKVGSYVTDDSGNLVWKTKAGLEKAISHKNKTLNPEWTGLEHDLLFNCKDIENQYLLVEIWDKDMIKSEIIGNVFIPINEIQNYSSPRIQCENLCLLKNDDKFFKVCVSAVSEQKAYTFLLV